MLQKQRNESFLEKVHYKALKGGKLMASFSSVTKRDIGPKIAVAKAKAKKNKQEACSSPHD